MTTNNPPPKQAADIVDFSMDQTALTGTASADHDGSPFFADATLPLEVAHIIAETPEPKKPVLDISSNPPGNPRSLELGPLREEPNHLTDEPIASTTTPMSNTERSAATDGTATTAGTTPTATSSNADDKMTTVTLTRLSHTPESSEGADGRHSNSYRPRPPRRPRDIPWAVAFCLYCPLVLLIGTLLRYDREDGSPIALKSAPRRCTFWAIVFAFGAATLGLSRLLYRIPPGGTGEDARHVASQVLLAFAPISLAVHPLLMMLIYLKTPHALSYAIIPAFFLFRDVWAMRQWKTTASTAGGRQAFFQAIVNMALDILSRSLKRTSLIRVVWVLLTVQFFVVLWWRRALLGCLCNGGSTGMFLLVLVAGKWATGTVSRLLGLVASGGVTNWFVQQSLLMEQLEQAKQKRQEEAAANGDVVEDSQSGNVVHSQNPNMLEEYRTVDASAYQPVMDLDEGVDDDGMDEDEAETEAVTGMAGIFNEQGNSTVRGFLVSGLTVSFGSVAQCGLLGGFAQFVWSILRNLDGIARFYQNRFGGGFRAVGGFRGMQIGDNDAATTIYGLLAKIFGQLHTMARNFVLTHSDLAMCQVASYYKSYQRAAQDVAVLVDGSGIEPIIHDDITTHMCACVCGSVSGIIVMFFGLILDRHQAKDHIQDKTVVQSMLLAFILCYVLLFTVMEPLRASIKAIYVCFAQHPESLSQTFPLIFHRLNRISEANLV